MTSLVWGHRVASMFACLLHESIHLLNREDDLFFFFSLLMDGLMRICQASKVFSVQDFAQKGIEKQLMMCQSVDLCNNK